MDDLVLNIFSNARKSRISRKDFDELPSQKGLASNKKLQSSLSIAKNIEQPRSSDAFNSLMKGILDMGKRIDEKYSSKNIQTGRSSVSRPTQGTKGEGSKKWKAEFDKIKQEKNEDDDNREDKAVGTSAQCIGNPYLEYIQNFPRRNSPHHYHNNPQIRIISPQGSRIVVGPDNSRIVFPPQLVQVRPLSTPKQFIEINPEFEPLQVRSRIVVGQPMSPRRVVMAQPIVRREFVEGQCIRPTSQQYGHAPQNILPPNYHIVNGPRQPHYNHPQAQIPQQFHPQQYQNQPQFHGPPHGHPQNLNMMTNQHSQQPLQVQQAEPHIQKQQKLNSKPPQETATPAPASNSPQANKPMTPEQYQSLLQKQYQLYNTQNSELLKHLASLSEQQKKQYMNQQVLKQAFKNTQNQNNAQNVKNVINEKKIVRIVEKNVVNKENIHNVENVRNQTNVGTVNNQCNVLNMHNMQYLQQFAIANGQAQTMIGNQAILRQIMANNMIANGQGVTASGKRLPLQPITTSRKNINISTKSIPSPSNSTPIDNSPIPFNYPQQKLSKQQQLSTEALNKQLFSQTLKQNVQKLDTFGESMAIDSHVADLQAMKKDGVRDGMLYLRKMDEILEKYGKKPVEFQDWPEEHSKKKGDEGYGDTIMNKLSTLFNNQQDRIPVSTLVQSRVSHMPETHRTVNKEQQPKGPTESTNNRHFLSLTKDMVFDFITNLGK